MSPWSKKTTGRRSESRTPTAQSDSRSKRKSPGDVIYIADPALLKKYPWLLACTNVRIES